jgi:hypothetical protein
MITSSNLITLKLPSIEDYYCETVQNLVDGKTNLARNRFKALSRKQRKDFFFHVSKEWQISSGDSLYDFFFELL